MFVKKYYGYGVIPSSNHQILREEKSFSKCDVMLFIKHLCILKYNTITSTSRNRKKGKKDRR